MMDDATYEDYPAVVDWEIANITFPKVLTLGCPNKGCNTWFRVRPLRLNTTWHYRSKCPTCGATSSLLRRIQTKCPNCGKINLASEANKLGGCDCRQDMKNKKYRSPTADEFDLS
jgi:hypothetical protein